MEKLEFSEHLFTLDNNTCHVLKLTTIEPPLLQKGHVLSTTATFSSWRTVHTLTLV